MRRAITIPAAGIFLVTAAVLTATAKERPVTASGVVPHAVRVTIAQEGTWTAEAREDGRIDLSLHWQQGSNWGRPFDRADLRGVTDEQIRAAASTPVTFRLEREAGAIDFEGNFREGKGAGHFQFHPDRGFAAMLRSLGIGDADRVTDGDLLVLTMGDASSASLRELGSLGVRARELEEVIALSIHHVTPDYVRELRGLGLEGTNGVEGVVELRIHGISAAFVRELESVGYRGLSRDQLLAMGIHGVSAEQVRELRALGYRDLTAQQAVDMRIHGVTPDYIRSMREAGFGDLDPEALVEMRIHNVSSRYIRELAEAGYRDLPLDQLMQMGIHGVTPEFIREVREAGFRDLSAETLVQMKIHGIGSEYVRGARRNR